MLSVSTRQCFSHKHYIAVIGFSNKQQQLEKQQIKATERRTFTKVSLRSFSRYITALNSEHTFLYSFYIKLGIKSRYVSKKRTKLRRVQVGVMERRGQMLRKGMAVETVNEWLLETLGERCVEMLTRP